MAGPAQGIAVHPQSTAWVPEGFPEVLRGPWGGKGTNLPGHSPRAAATSCKPSGSSVLLPFSCQDCPGSTAGEGGQATAAPRPLPNATAVARGRRPSRCVPAEPCPAPGTTTKPLQGASPAATTRPGSGPGQGREAGADPPGLCPAAGGTRGPTGEAPGGAGPGPDGHQQVRLLTRRLRPAATAAPRLRRRPGRADRRDPRRAGPGLPRRRRGLRSRSPPGLRQRLACRAVARRAAPAAPLTCAAAERWAAQSLAAAMFPTRREGGERGRERGQARPGPAPRRPLLPGTAPPRRARGSWRGPSPARLCSARLGPTRLSRTLPSVSERRGQPHAVPTSRRDRPRPPPALWAQCRLSQPWDKPQCSPEILWVPESDVHPRLGPHAPLEMPGTRVAPMQHDQALRTDSQPLDIPFLPPPAGPLPASCDPLLGTQIIAVLSEQNTTCICPFAPTKNDK